MFSSGDGMTQILVFLDRQLLNYAMPFFQFKIVLFLLRVLYDLYVKLNKKPTLKLFALSNLFSATFRKDLLLEDVLPQRFYDLILGIHQQFSCALWVQGAQHIDEAELAMLDLIYQRASLSEANHILLYGYRQEIFAYYLLKRRPNCSITIACFSSSQRDNMLSKLEFNSIKQVTVITLEEVYDVASDCFDRVLILDKIGTQFSKSFQKRIKSSLKAQAKVFISRFGFLSESNLSFGSKKKMQHLDIKPEFNYTDLLCKKTWFIDSMHYTKTIDAWLKNLEHNKLAIKCVLKQEPIKRKNLWKRWQRFFHVILSLSKYQKDYRIIFYHQVYGFETEKSGTSLSNV